jgi:hypothetical protein
VRAHTKNKQVVRCAQPKESATRLASVALRATDSAAAHPDSICCSRCSGTGIVRLPTELQASLDLLRKYGELTALLLWKSMTFGGVTAANNRLETLRQLGFAKRERVNGKVWKYSAVTP